jgi:thiamine phosphate synthase YjbQ (UPF0047 family)
MGKKSKISKFLTVLQSEGQRWYNHKQEDKQNKHVNMKTIIIINYIFISVLTEQPEGLQTRTRQIGK